MSSRVKRVENRPLKLHTFAVNRDLTLHLVLAISPEVGVNPPRARIENLLAGGRPRGGEGTEGMKSLQWKSGEG